MMPTFGNWVLPSRVWRASAVVLLLACNCNVVEAEPETPFSDCADCPTMMPIRPGSFVMGSPPEETARERIPARDAGWERPQHRVEIKYRFAIGQYLVTRGQWEACVVTGGCNGYRPEDRFRSLNASPDRPVNDISFQDAQAYVDWLNGIVKVPSGNLHYYLPSEAEWEYAARAGTVTARWWGDDKRDSGPQPMARNDLPPFPGSPDKYPPNNFGLHDMLGPVWQWTADCWTEDYRGAPVDGSPRHEGDCDRRVVRGGSYSWGRPWRSAARLWFRVSVRSDDAGFRVARRLP